MNEITVETIDESFTVEVEGGDFAAVVEVEDFTVEFVGGDEFTVEFEPGESTVIEAREQGPPGPQGVAGPPGPRGDAGPGGGTLSHPFAFGDAAQLVYTATQAGRLVGVSLSVRVGFDGVAPLVLLGKAGTPPDDVLDAGDSDPAAADLYGRELDYPLAAGDALTLTVVPSGSTRGEGVLTLFFA